MAQDTQRIQKFQAAAAAFKESPEDAGKFLELLNEGKNITGTSNGALANTFKLPTNNIEQWSKGVGKPPHPLTRKHIISQLSLRSRMQR